jgi:hypothetical protein
MIFSFSIRSNMFTVTCFYLACSGKTALAATIGIESGFPFIKIVSAENMIGLQESTKCGMITKVAAATLSAFEMRTFCLAFYIWTS